MANGARADITGQLVELKGSGPVTERLFKVNDYPNAGFGAKHDNMGSAVFGKYVGSEAATRIEGSQVKRIVPQDEAERLLAR